MATSTSVPPADGPQDAPADAPGGPGSGGSKDTRQRRRNLFHRLDVGAAPYTFIAPFFVIFAAFSFYPLLYTSWISLHDVELATMDVMVWQGLQNYTELLQDERFWNAVANTATIGVISAVPQLLMALGLAHLLNYRMRGSAFFRVAALTPYATSVGAAALVFTMLFERDFGMINWFLSLFGFDNVDWESQKWPAQFAISSIVIWRWTGYNALLYLAAMQAIPKDRYEAAAIDGATRWQQFRTVTIPGIRPTIVFTIVLSTIGSTQLFGEPLIFGQGPNGITGGVNNQYQTLGLLLYEEGWKNYQMGRAATVAWTMFLLLILVFVAQRLIKRLMASRQAAARPGPAAPPPASPSSSSLSSSSS
ncbi:MULTISPECIES: carbohydrate ABC transporter permease [Streptomyces]|uniref:Sugar ABC transporter permease n=1 Tax=Streptomyces xinghaiensis TaxID=1038928 RepID=A0A420UYV2_9ACTN|nr:MULTISPECIES: sugar ABC transporter permease [Streptomyces]MZE76131.1 ABC transporter permease subunit [Streptomyces sp. SID5475]PQM21720.1 sugar ABC transporter permease [Streptomyces xinghaiensis]RKM93153.1 sugar ABC transporter permease [Streptomyces xinghaiensis]RNC71249.1 sugar ABC transporter permease [Streptomyces xinghaiensis]